MFRMMFRNKRKHKGESLIETVICILVIAIIIGAVLVITNYIHSSRARWRQYNELHEESVTIIDAINADIAKGVDVTKKDYGQSATKTVTGKSGKQYAVSSGALEVNIQQDTLYSDDVYLVTITAREGGDLRVITKTILSKPAGWHG